LTSNVEVARCARDNEKPQCIKIVEKFITNEIGRKFLFSKDNSDRLWKILGKFTLLPKSFKQSMPSTLETSVTKKSPFTPLNLSTLFKSVDEIHFTSLVLATDSKKSKGTNFDSSVPFVYALRSR
jgi:hypothetical protein